MTRPHDMGGRFGDGPVQPEPEDVKFHADWHARAMALTVAAGATGLWSIDDSRRARESLAPKDYAAFSYYEKWIAGLADLLVEKGAATVDEMSGAVAPARATEGRVLTAPQVAPALAKGAPADRPSEIAQAFHPGDAVVTRRAAGNTLVKGGHTRLPLYAAGVQGEVLRYHGTHVLPDTNAHGFGDRAEPLYAIAFRAGDLWAHPEHPEDSVVVDLWQSYLSPAT